MTREQKLLVKNIDPYEEKVPAWAVVLILVGTLVLVAPGFLTLVGIIYKSYFE